MGKLKDIGRLEAGPGKELLAPEAAFLMLPLLIWWCDSLLFSYGVSILPFSGQFTSAGWGLYKCYSMRETHWTVLFSRFTLHSAHILTTEVMPSKFLKQPHTSSCYPFLASWLCQTPPHSSAKLSQQHFSCPSKARPMLILLSFFRQGDSSFPKPYLHSVCKESWDHNGRGYVGILLALALGQGWKDFRPTDLELSVSSRRIPLAIRLPFGSK